MPLIMPAGSQTVKLVITVEQPILLSLQVGETQAQSEAQIQQLNAELASLRQQMADYRAQLMENGGVLKTAQGKLAESHQALVLERQKTEDLTHEVKALSDSVDLARKAAADANNVAATATAAAAERGPAIARQHSVSAPSSRRTTGAAVGEGDYAPSSSGSDAGGSGSLFAASLHKGFKAGPSGLSQVITLDLTIDGRCTAGNAAHVKCSTSHVL